jgi:signal transduction histidine kinase
MPAYESSMTVEQTNILIVDDLPEKQLVYQSILEDLGQNLVTARSGPEALKQVLRHEFAVILLDVNMPGMDGFETAALIRKRKKSAHTPIIFVTAFADDLQMAQGYAHGAVDFIPTPVIPDVLRSKVRVFVDLYRMTQQAKQQARERLALAEERVKRAAAEDTNRRLAFLARAGAVLGRSLDAPTTGRDLAVLAVPFLADQSVVAITDAAGLRVTRARLDDDGQVGVEETRDYHGLASHLSARIQRVFETGAPEFYDGGDAAAPPAPTVTVWPLQARGQTTAAMALVFDSSGRSFGPTELTMSEALASRGAVALDNARLHKDLQDADRRKDEFLAMLAHELRNPLGPIRNAVHILGITGPQAPPLVQAREMIERQVPHMARLVDDLLDATRIARGKILLRKERCDLVRILHQTAADYRSVFDASGIQFDTEASDEPVWIEGDPTRLAQMLGNLLHNAHKFTNPGDRVKVWLGCNDQQQTAWVTVADTGIGIDAVMLPRLFEVFSQADRSLDRSRGGLGLGLALVRGLAELHGGQVKATSAGPGLGSEFTITLPMAERPREPVPAPAEEVNGKPRRVLVIEDNKDAAESARMLLSLAGHDVRTAYTGRTGLEMAQEFRPQVILCDIGLPGGMNGYEVARAVRENPELAPAYVIALTGYGRDEDQRQAQEAGFDLHLTKPVDYDILRRAVAASTYKTAT